MLDVFKIEDSYSTIIVHINYPAFRSRAAHPKPLQIGCDRVISRGEATRSVGVRAWS